MCLISKSRNIIDSLQKNLILFTKQKIGTWH